MHPGAITAFAEKVTAGGAPRPEVVFNDGASGVRDGVIHLQTADAWPEVSAVFLAWLFHCARRDTLTPEAEGAALAVVLRHAQIKCPGCGNAIGLPAACPGCFRNLK